MKIKLLGLAVASALLILPATVVAAPSPNMQAGAARAYSLLDDVNDHPGDSPAVREARQRLQEAFSEYGKAVDAHGRNSSEAREAGGHVDYAQQHLHMAIGDFDQTKWAAYLHSRDLWLDRHNYDVSRRDSDMKHSRFEANKNFYDLKVDMKDVSTDNAVVARDRANLRNAFTAYGQAVDQKGVNSPQASAARAQIDRNQIALHKDLHDYDEAVWHETVQHRDLEADRKAYQQTLHP